MTSRESRFDERIAAALDDVPVPAGLAERLLASLAASPVAASEKAEFAAESEPAITAAIPLFSPHARRRRWLTTVAACAATLLIGIASWRLLSPAANPEADLPTLAMTWADQLSDAWQPMKLTPADFAVPTAINATPSGWQRATTVSGRQAVVFNLSRRGLRAMVFVIRMAGGQLPNAPPADPQLRTGGQSIGAWQSRAGVCVLVIEGDDRAYRSLIRSGGIPMA
jgi:hypothetical protein